MTPQEALPIIQGIVAGNPWQVQHGSVWDDREPTDILLLLSDICAGREIRLKPWTLPDPPEGRQWHNADAFTQEHLPDGTRPWMVGEVLSHPYEYRHDGKWYGSYKGNVASYLDGTIHRTTLPVEQAQFADDPPPKRWADLGPEDVPPGSAFRHPGWEKGLWRQANQVTAMGITWVFGGSLVDWDELNSGGWFIQRPGQNWTECRKEVAA